MYPKLNSTICHHFYQNSVQAHKDLYPSYCQSIYVHSKVIIFMRIFEAIKCYCKYSYSIGSIREIYGISPKLNETFSP